MNPGFSVSAVGYEIVFHFNSPATGSLTARDSGAPRDIGAPGMAFRFLLQRRRPGGMFLRGSIPGPHVPLIVTLGKVSAKERYPQLLLRARACGNVKNLSLLSGYTLGSRRLAVMNMFP